MKKTVLHYVKPLTAYECLNRLILQINNKSIKLRYSDKVSFVNHNELISDVIVKGLLAKRYGGLESSNVLVIASNNHFDFYQCINIATKKYKININKVLDHVIITRVFTIYQLAYTLTQELPELIKKYEPQLLVIISDLFLTDEKVRKEEKERIIRNTVKSLEYVRTLSMIVVIFSTHDIKQLTNYKIYGEFLE